MLYGEHKTKNYKKTEYVLKAMNVKLKMITCVSDKENNLITAVLNLQR